MNGKIRPRDPDAVFLLSDSSDCFCRPESPTWEEPIEALFCTFSSFYFNRRLVRSQRMNDIICYVRLYNKVLFMSEYDMIHYAKCVSLQTLAV